MKLTLFDRTSGEKNETQKSAMSDKTVVIKRKKKLKKKTMEKEIEMCIKNVKV